ncbi:MAG: thioredoxin-disulfide reductase [Zetaproteobacteria bacterium]|nr:thioredoxin-disulfide reductase [Zetaproteobacteria bacterium]
MSVVEIAIIGTGPAGLTAAIYAARAGHHPVVFAGLQPGGQLTTTTDVENFPGFKEGIQGPLLMQEMTAQAERVGTQIKHVEIVSVDFSKSPHQLVTSEGETVQAKAVIIATGATAKTLGLEKEAMLMGRGLSTCATCDGFFYKDKKVAVVGGGDSAMEEALYLANICEQVLLIHRREGFRASNIMLERAQKHPKIEFMLPYEVDRFISDTSGLKGVVLRHSQTQAEQELLLDGLFYGIGHQPNSAMFADYLDLDEHDYLVVKNFTETKVPGVFAAGDIADPTFKQAITAAGMGCQAALQASKYLESL